MSVNSTDTSRRSGGRFDSFVSFAAALTMLTKVNTTGGLLATLHKDNGPITRAARSRLAAGQRHSFSPDFASRSGGKGQLEARTRPACLVDFSGARSGYPDITHVLSAKAEIGRENVIDRQMLRRPIE